MKRLGLALRMALARSPKITLNVYFINQQKLGKVAFSTGLKIDLDKLKDVEKVLFFFKENKKMNYVIADVLYSDTRKEPFIPEDMKDFIPSEYKDIPRNTWLMLSGMRRLDEEELSQYEYLYDSSIDIVEILNRDRFTRMFFKKKNDSSIPLLFN